MMRKILLALSIALFPVLGATPNVPAASGCSNETLRGSYGIHATGTVAAGPVAIVGVLSYDGNGQLTGNLTQRVNGATTLFKAPFTGVYQVNADCTVEDTFINVTTGAQSTHESVIVDRGRGFSILNTSAGTVLGEARKQFVRDEDN
jgi:hypothetical protein